MSPMDRIERKRERENRIGTLVSERERIGPTNRTVWPLSRASARERERHTHTLRFKFLSSLICYSSVYKCHLMPANKVTDLSSLVVIKGQLKRLCGCKHCSFI